MGHHRTMNNQKSSVKSSIPGYTDLTEKKTHHLLLIQQVPNLEWLLNDNIALSAIGVTKNVLQRYALAVLYYSTDGQNWKGDLNFLSESDVCAWNNGLIQRNESESLALMVFFAMVMKPWI